MTESKKELTPEQAERALNEGRALRYRDDNEVYYVVLGVEEKMRANKSTKLQGQVIYTVSELSKLSGLSKADRITVHRVMRKFPGSDLESVEHELGPTSLTRQGN